MTVDGADTVFWLVPPNPQADDVTGYYRQFNAPFCDAIGQHSVKRAMYVTALGRGYHREVIKESGKRGQAQQGCRTGVSPGSVGRASAPPRATALLK